MAHQDEEALGKGYDARLFRRLLHYLRPYKWRSAAALFLSIVTAGLGIVTPYFTAILIDAFLLPAVRQAIPAAQAFQGIKWMAVSFIDVLALIFVLSVSQVMVMQLVGQKAMFDLRGEIFRQLQRLPISFYDRNPVGRLLTRVTTDVDALYELFASGIVAMLTDVFRLLFIVGVMLKLNWRLALLTFAVLPLIVLVTALFRRSFREANRRIRTAIAKINSFLQEYISGMTVVQLFNRERKAMKQFSQINRDHMLAFKDAILAHALFYPAVEFLGVAAIASLLWFGGLWVIAGSLQLGILVAFMQYAQQMFRPIQDLSEKFAILQSAMAASERIFKLLDEPVHAATGSERLATPRGEIEFRNVWFAYPAPPPAPAHPGAPVPAVPAVAAEPDWVLRDVSFRAAPGETIAVVGHTGAGKTTIISLLLRFYEIQRGEILLDGRDIRILDVHELRRHFGIVLQDPFLFTGTLESNVKLGTAGISSDDVRRAMEEVRLGSMLAALPEGLASQVTERGATYSVGQRQLISFARALAHNPRFLILDEATSSVDTQTESMIREALDRLLEGRTALVVAHRLSTIQRADRILVMHKGKLREQGTHQELLAERGIYYKLYQLQYKEQEHAGGLAAPVGSAIPATD